MALVCHPHPLQGGTLDNKVVQTLAKAFFALGYVATRFNFRGVGQSAGTFDEGIGETDDALAVLAHVRARFGEALPVALAGFSFGSFVQTRVAEQVHAEGLVLVGPAVNRFAGARTCRRTRSSCTARRTTSCRSPTCSRGRGRRQLADRRVSRAAGISSTAACRNSRASSRHCGRAMRARIVAMNDTAQQRRAERRVSPRRATWRRTSLRVRDLRKRYGELEVVRGLSLRDPPRRVLRAARPQRRRQDDDAALLPRPDRSRRRHDRAGRRAGAEGGARGAHPRRRRAADGQPRSRFHRPRKPAGLRRLFPASGAASSTSASRACSNSPASPARRRRRFARCRAA